MAVTRYGAKRYSIGPYVKEAEFADQSVNESDWTEQDDDSGLWIKQQDEALETWLDLTNRN